MSKLFRLLFIGTLLSSCGAEVKEEKAPISEKEQTDFKSWHTGKYYYKEPGVGTFLINRTGSIQEEFIKNTGMIVEFDINWGSDSSYILSFVKISENPLNKKLAAGADTLIKHCTMTAVQTLSYVEQTTSNLSSDTLYTTIYRH